MIGRWAFIVVLAGIAAIAAFAQIDRAARDDAALSTLVPAPFRGFAAESRTRLLVMANQPDAALAEARLLVRHRPMKANNLSLLFAAATVAQRDEEAAAALELAGTRGWREPIAQLALASAAQNQDLPDLAAMRIVAILAVGQFRDQAMALLQRLLATPAGREAFARQLAAEGYWQDRFLRSAIRSYPRETASDLLVRAEAQGARFNCRRHAAIEKIAREGGTPQLCR